jgi:(p)ppGpp synthase/HD superfamily hydrolase
MELRAGGVLVFGPIEDERAEKMLSLTSEAAYSERRFLEALAPSRPKERISEALVFAKSLNFSNSSLKSSYLSHPFRVAMFLAKIQPDASDAALTAALLHNVLETTTLKIDAVTGPFGAEVGGIIETLTVDRSRPFLEIENEYYRRIEAAGPVVQLIKLLDKMDNLFVLCLNANAPIRAGYTAEIRARLLPFASAFLPGLGQYLSSLLDDADRLGFSPDLKQKLNQYQQAQKESMS